MDPPDKPGDDDRKPGDDDTGAGNDDRRPGDDEAELRDGVEPGDGAARWAEWR
jgi:hypothetical protein